MTRTKEVEQSHALVLLANYSPFLFLLGLFLGLIVHVFYPIVILHTFVFIVHIVGILFLVIASVLLVLVQKVRSLFYTELYENICNDVRRGPYKISRHPGALSLVVLLLGVSLVVNSLALLLMTVVLWGVFTWIIHPFQEALLKERCGDLYNDYIKKVRMWL